MVSCNSKNKEREQQQIKVESKIQEKEVDTIKVQNVEKVSLKTKNNSKIKILVLGCYNGYGRNDFRKHIESEIRKNNEFEIIPFPNKKLLGVAYQGVYDKKYCKPIIDKIDVDYIIMTRFLGNIENGIENIGEKTTIWGYETKMLNVKSMNQKVSIRKDNLKEYQDILIHIKKNGNTLNKDIENFK